MESKSKYVEIKRNDAVQKSSMHEIDIQKAKQETEQIQYGNPLPVETAAMEGGRLLETWDDLLDLEPGSTVLVPIEAALGEAVWIWLKSLDATTPPGEMARGVREVLLGLSRNEKVRMLEGVQTLLFGLAGVLPRRALQDAQ